MKIIISGLGVMGGSLALAIKQNLPDVQIYGYDKPAVLEEALAQNFIDEKIANWPQDCVNADIVFLASPLNVLNRHLQDLNGVVNRQTVVTDVGSTKRELSLLAQKIKFSGTYAGGHPMTGAEKSGLKAANPLLFENAVYLLCGSELRENKIIKEKLLPVLDAVKARVLLIDAELHDEILAAISHLPQILAVELVNLAGALNSEEKPYFALAAGGFRDLTRIASSSIDIWQDIINSNKKNINKVLRMYIRSLENAANRLDDLKPDFETANDYRRQVPKTGKGFLSPLTDVMVFVTDQVGVVAKIASALTEKDIDIRDIELLKIREKEGGVFRLSFDSVNLANDAVKILENIGFQAFLRE